MLRITWNSLGERDEQGRTDAERTARRITDSKSQRLLLAQLLHRVRVSSNGAEELPWNPGYSELIR